MPETKKSYGDPPGQFRVLVNGLALNTDTPVGTVFGMEGSDWHWQSGGTVDINETNVNLALHDLTGYEGRCDAILFSTDVNLVPPNQDPNMRIWRRILLGIPENPTEMGYYDLVVVGGGIAGTAAAVQASRQGLTVALIQDRPVLGGNNSSEVRVGLGGNTNYEPYSRIGNIVNELDPCHGGNCGPAFEYNDLKKLAVVQAEANIDMFLNYRANGVETDGNTITAVIAESTETGHWLHFTGHCFADCTGDGSLGYLAGADYEITLSSPGHMGRSNLWRVVDTGSYVYFPPCPWALNLHSKPFPTLNLGNWFWESGFMHNPFEKSEYIRDWNFRAMYGAWDALKNTIGGHDNDTIEWAAYISGKRESRRLIGDVVLTKNDLTSGVEYPDAVIPTSWLIDIHVPAYESGFEADAFISKANYTEYSRPYWIPYRCLYSVNINNLFMAGRDISVTHEALGALRVMRTTGMMGEVVGAAASLCVKYDTTPRGVYQNYLGQLQETLGYNSPMLGPWRTDIGPNYALDATVEVYSYHSSSGSKDLINDGFADTNDNSERWLSSSLVLPDFVDFHFSQPIYLSAAQVISGWYNGISVQDPVQDFHFEHWSGSAWQQIPGSIVTANEEIERTLSFESRCSNKFRLSIKNTPGSIARIWEVKLYHPVADINQDGDVDMADLVDMAEQWLMAGSALSADLDDNNEVNGFDFSVVGEFWNW